MINLIKKIFNMLVKKESEITDIGFTTLLPAPDYNLIEENHTPYVIKGVRFTEKTENDKHLINR